MASLNAFLTRRQLVPLEDNLEQGQISVYTQSSQIGNYIPYGFCWKAPGAGTAIIEAWGSGGSSAQMCCCGGTLPGNTGAYVKKTIRVAAGCYVCGQIGMSCGNASALCFRGCSESTCFLWTGCGTSGCICAQGGMGGYSYCSTGTPLYCCYRNGSFCASQDPARHAAGCGIVCNVYPGYLQAQGFGGDINCPGNFGCVSFLHCDPAFSDRCYSLFHVPVPPGIIATNGALITFGKECCNDFHNTNGGGYHQFISSLNAASRGPSSGIPWTTCWPANVSCGGCVMQGCMPFMPPGFGGVPGNGQCVNYSDYGWRGGHGLVRIKYLDYCL